MAESPNHTGRFGISLRRCRRHWYFASPSGLADVDLDCREAIAAADELLPQTEMVHGHISSRRSHRYFRPTSIPKNKSFNDPRLEKAKSARAMIVELRANGQTIVPPSINLRTGEPVEWDSEGEPATVDGDVLAAAVAQVAAAALLGTLLAERVATFRYIGARRNAATGTMGERMRWNGSS